jgi:hypothetical protein
MATITLTNSKNGFTEFRFVMGAIDRNHYNPARRLIEVRQDDGLLLVTGTDGHRLHRWTSAAAYGSRYPDGLYMIREDTQKRIKLERPDDWNRLDFPDVDTVIKSSTNYTEGPRHKLITFQQKFSVGDAGEYTLIAKLLRFMINSTLTVEYITELYRRGSESVEGEWDITLVNELEEGNVDTPDRWACQKPIAFLSPEITLQAYVMPRRQS